MSQKAPLPSLTGHRLKTRKRGKYVFHINPTLFITLDWSFRIQFTQRTTFEYNFLKSSYFCSRECNIIFFTFR